MAGIGDERLTRILTGLILADNADGTFEVDIDGTGSGLTVVRAPTVAVGEIGTVLDVGGAQVLIGPRTGDDQPYDSLAGQGSFETWHSDVGYQPTTSGLVPDGWDPFWGSAAIKGVAPYGTWVADGVLSAALSITAVSGASASLIGGGIATAAFRAPSQDMNLRVTGTYKPLSALTGCHVAAQVYWGTTDAEAMPFGGGKVATLFDTTLTSSTAEVAFDVTTPAPTGAYTYCRVFLNFYQKASATYLSGTVAFDGVRAEFLDTGSASTPWLPYTPVVTGSTTNPNIGTAGSGASAKGRYQKNGTLVTGWFDIRMGSSGGSAGSGDYGVTLPPVPAQSEMIGTFAGWAQTAAGVFRAAVFNMSVSGGVAAVTTIYATTNAASMIQLTSAATPIPAAGSYRLKAVFQYEAAVPLPV